MLLQEISDEFIKLYEKVNAVAPDFADEMFSIWGMAYNEFTIKCIPLFSKSIRKISRLQGALENEIYISTSVKKFVAEFSDKANLFYARTEEIMAQLSKSDKINLGNITVINLRKIAEQLYEWNFEIRTAKDILLMVEHETWEPLPTDLKEKCEDIIISSETKSTTLGNVSKDIESLNSFLDNIYYLINQDKENSYFLRKVETGSLSVVISCITAVTPIVSFIFFVIKLCQNTEKRDLNNKDKKLELINKNLDIAKKILEIDPQNTEANEIIQKSGLYLLQYFENNPKGTINGKRYDIGMEILKIEEKKDE